MSAAAAAAASEGESLLCLCGDDVLAAILSCLPACDVASCACVCQRLCQLARNDLKVWLPMCERRWGDRIDVRDWHRGEGGGLTYRHLSATLERAEELIGFWRSVGGEGDPASLLCFGWGEGFIEGFRVLPGEVGALTLTQVPFARVLARDDGQLAYYVDTSWGDRWRARETDTLQAGSMWGHLGGGGAWLPEPPSPGQRASPGASPGEISVSPGQGATWSRGAAEGSPGQVLGSKEYHSSGRLHATPGTPPAASNSRSPSSSFPSPIPSFPLLPSPSPPPSGSGPRSRGKEHLASPSSSSTPTATRPAPPAPPVEPSASPTVGMGPNSCSPSGTPSSRAYAPSFAPSAPYPIPLGRNAHGKSESKSCTVSVEPGDSSAAAAAAAVGGGGAATRASGVLQAGGLEPGSSSCSPSRGAPGGASAGLAAGAGGEEGSASSPKSRRMVPAGAVGSRLPTTPRNGDGYGHGSGNGVCAGDHDDDSVDDARARRSGRARAPEEVQGRRSRGSSLPPGIAQVDVEFVSENHLMIKDLDLTRQRAWDRDSSLVEAATLASFGSGERLADLATSPARDTSSSPGSSGSAPVRTNRDWGGRAGADLIARREDLCSQSPPGSLPYEMYRFLASRVAASGSDRAARKQRRRERERAASAGRATLSLPAEHYVRVLDCAPHKARPLQGLWKGMCEGGNLVEVVELAYEHRHIVCKQVACFDVSSEASLAGQRRGGGRGRTSNHSAAARGPCAVGSVRWTAKLSSHRSVAPTSASSSSSRGDLKNEGGPAHTVEATQASALCSKLGSSGGGNHASERLRAARSAGGGGISRGESQRKASLVEAAAAAAAAAQETAGRRPVVPAGPAGAQGGQVASPRGMHEAASERDSGHEVTQRSLRGTDGGGLHGSGVGCDLAIEGDVAGVFCTLAGVDNEGSSGTRGKLWTYSDGKIAYEAQASSAVVYVRMSRDSQVLAS
eukprot:jgi/Mesen1/10267/ME000778S09600